MSRAIALVTAVSLAAAAGPARAGVTIDLTDTGSGITATAVGSINTSALTTNVNTISNAGSGGGLFDFGGGLGSTQGLLTAGTTYRLLSGPTFAGPTYPFFGAERSPQTQIPFDTSSGSAVGLVHQQSVGVTIALPSTYVSGTAISATGTWNTLEFDRLGVTAGQSFTWTWGAGATADFLTINVGTPVPEPSTLAWCGAAAVTAVGGLVRRRYAVNGGHT